MLSKKSALLLSGLLGLTLHGADYDHTLRYPEFLQRGNCRPAFYTNAAENYPATYINLMRGPVRNDKDMMQKAIGNCYTMEYISPSDCWWNDSLYKRAYRTTLEKAPYYKWLCNILDVLPVLKDALCKKADGSDFILHEGSPVERKVGCRNNPLWLDYRIKDSLAYIGKVETFAGDPLFYDFFASRPSVISKLTRVIFYDNASFVGCACNLCFEGYRKLWNERFGNRPLPVTREHFILSDKLSVLYKQYPEKWKDIIEKYPEAGALFWEYQTKILTDFYARLSSEINRYGVYSMPNYTQGYGFMSLNQIKSRTTDSICWETSWMHPPFDRLLPWYKRGLAASRGRVNAAVCDFITPRYIPFWSRALRLDESSVIVPEFTQMALAEGFANGGSYIVKGELLGNFTEPVRVYNKFNKDNQIVYRDANRGGRVAVLVPLRSGLVNLRDDKVTNRLLSRLSGNGIPVEVIVEDDLLPEPEVSKEALAMSSMPHPLPSKKVKKTLRDNYDLIIAPDFDCVTEEWAKALSEFHQKGGALILSPEFGIHDYYRRKSDSKLCAELRKQAAKGIAKMATLNNYGNELSDKALVELLTKTFGGSLPQRFHAPEGSEYGVNMLDQKAFDLKSFHIVNYRYRLKNPVHQIHKMQDSVSFSLPVNPGRLPQKLYIYGQPLAKGCGIDVWINGKKIRSVGGVIDYSVPWLGLKDGESIKAGDAKIETTINLKGTDDRRYYEVDLDGIDFKDGKCHVELKPHEKNIGGFQLFIDPALDNDSKINGKKITGGFAAFFSPVSPAKFVPVELIPIPSGRLELSGYTADYQVLLISPDRKAQMLKTTLEKGRLIVTVPQVDIYSVLLISKDRKLLDSIAKSNMGE